MMHDFIRLALLLGIAASAATLIGAGIAFWMDEHRRLTRIAWRVLGGEPDALIVAQGRDAAAAFRIAANQILVMRDGGANALLYPLSALEGADLSIDDEVVARVARGESRRNLERTPKQVQQVVLRLLFDDPRHPEFALDLWLPLDEFRRQARAPHAVIQEARAWLSRAEAIMRRARPTKIAIGDATVDSLARAEPEPPPPPTDTLGRRTAEPEPSEIEDDADPFDDDDLGPMMAAPPSSPPVAAPPVAPPRDAQPREETARTEQLPLF